MEDMIEQANEIQESLGRSYGVPDEVDEADLQAGEQSFVYDRLRSRRHKSKGEPAGVSDDADPITRT